MADSERLATELLADDPSVRRKALRRLPAITGSASKLLDLLISALQRDQQRPHALAALQRLGPRAQPAVPAVLEVFKKSWRMQECQFAWRVLLATDSEGNALAAAAIHNSRDSNRAITNSAQSQRVLKTLTKRLSEAEEISAAKNQERVLKAKSLKGSMRRILSEPDYTDVVAVVSAMGVLRGDAVNMLVTLLGHSVPEVRDAAANALRRIGKPAAASIEPLLTAISNPSTARPNMVAALAEIATEQVEVIAPIVEYMTRPESDAKAGALALASFGSGGVPALREAMNSHDPNVRRAVVLAAQSAPAVAPSLVAELERALLDSAAGVQREAARALRTAVPNSRRWARVVLNTLASLRGIDRSSLISRVSYLLDFDALIDALGDQQEELADAAADLFVATVPYFYLERLVSTSERKLPTRTRARIARVLARMLPSVRRIRVGRRTVDVSWLLENWGAAQGLASATDILEALDGPRFPGVSFASAPEPPSAREVLAALERRASVLVRASNAIASLPDSAVEREFEGVGTPRYTDLTPFHGHLYAGDTTVGRQRLADDQPLVPGDYTLEVAVRAIRVGLRDDKVAPRAVNPPAVEQEHPFIYVYARSLLKEVVIENNLVKLTWPAGGDSDIAFIRIKVAWSPCESDEDARRLELFGNWKQGRVEVRLFDAGLDLLDAIYWETVVAPELGSRPKSWAQCQDVHWPRFKPDPVPVPSEVRRRAMSINVAIVGASYQLDFILPTSSGALQVASRMIAIDDLKQLNWAVQDLWTKLVLSNYAEQVTVAAATLEAHLAKLRGLGARAWDLVFGARFGSSAGPSESLGDLLAHGQVLREGDLIQVGLVDPSLAFTFPWAILCPPKGRGGDKSPQFWGVRFQIEQVTKGRETDNLGGEPVQVLFALDRGFKNASAQADLFKSYAARAGKRLEVTGPIADEDTLINALCRVPAAHLVYCYCHSYSAEGTGRARLRADGVARLKKEIRKVGEPLQKQALETLLGLLERMDDVSWMFIGDSEVTEFNLRHQSFFQGRKPIVIMNSCQSAALEPSVIAGLARVFWDHDASVVIGCESVMTPTFAHPFGRRLLDALLGGSEVGDALQAARRHFLMVNRNPLGLAYTLYGRASTRLTDRGLLDVQGDTDGCT